MGEFTGGGYNHEKENMNNRNVMDTGDASKEYKTQDGFDCDGYKKEGNMDLPIFNVNQKEFYQNMMHGRKRLHFSSGSNVQQYMQNTKYRSPFYIKYKEEGENGKEYIRKVK